MPNYSSIQITFADDLVVDNSFGFTASSPAPNFILQYIGYRIVNIRFQSGQVSSSGLAPTLIPGERTAINFVQAFQLDWVNASSLYSITRSENVVTIYGQIPTLQFSGTFSYNDYLEFPATLNGNVTFEINNFNGTAFEITNVEIVQATTNPVCTHYKARVTTSTLASEWSVAFGPSNNSNTDNPFEFEIPRGQGFVLSCESSDGQSDTHFQPPTTAPPIMNGSNILVTINNSPLGATIIVSFVIVPIFSTGYEYSLDGTNWQSSNTFSGITSGNYTVRVRHLGCVITKDITVDNINNIVAPYFFISKSMSIRFAKRESIADCGPLRNDENSLSHEFYSEDPDLAYCEKQMFQSCDTITTQFKSNYSVLSANVIRENGQTQSLAVVQMTNNIGRKDARDAMKYNIGNNQTGIYFMSGNLYNYDTDADEGNDYILNGALPEYGKIGNWISIGNTYLQIKDIIFDEDLDAEVLVVDEAYTGNPTAIIVKAIFNRQKYEVYEFTTVMSLYNNETIEIEILGTDDNFDDCKYLSEKLEIKTKHDRTLKLHYYNVSNTDVYYATGIKNTIRVPLLFMRAGHVDESELLSGDSMSNLIKSNVYETYEYEIGLVTTGMYRKIIQALSHKFVEADDVAIIKNTNIEKEGPIESSNLFIIKAEMLKTNAPFNATVVGNDPDISFNEDNLEVPAAIIDGEGHPIVYE